MTNKQLQAYLNQIHLPKSDSHKGQNGKVMVIGGSELFHSASQWALEVVTKMVDMVFYASVPINNEIIKKNKEHFHNGIVIPRQEIENYIDEANVVLIGPGMERSQTSDIRFQTSEQPTPQDWNANTRKIVNYLLHNYPNKKWVIDAGALQMVEPSLLNKNCIITPHLGEFERLTAKLQNDQGSNQTTRLPIPPNTDFPNLPSNFPKTTILLKGLIDKILSTINYQLLTISGGNAGMTKGGTGDVLAGVVAGLFSFCDDPFAVAVVASTINKQAGDELYKTVGPFFNASDLVQQIPKTMAKVFGYTD